MTKYKPTKYKDKKGFIFIFLILILSALAFFFFAGNTTNIEIADRTIIDNSKDFEDSIENKVLSLETQVKEFKKKVDFYEGKDKALTSWTGKLLDTNKELSDLVDSSQASVRELIKQNQELLSMNDELIFTIKSIRR